MFLKRKWGKRLGLKSVIACLIFFLVFVTFGCATSKRNDTANKSNGTDKVEFKFRLAHVVQPTEPTHIAAQYFASEVKERTGGKIQINIYPQGQLGGDRDLNEQIQRGALEMGIISAAPIAGTSKVVNGLILPGLIENHEMMKKLYKSNFVYEFLSELEKHNLKVLAIYDYGFRHIATCKPVDNINDLVGKKIRVPENEVSVEIFKSLGCNPTPMAYGEIYSALQNRVIDGVDNDLSGLYSERFYEVAPYVLLSGQYTWPALLVINYDKWLSLPKEYQDILIKAANESIDTNVAEIIKVEDDYMKKMKEQKVKFIEVNKEALKIKYQPVYQKFLQDPDMEKFVKQVKALKTQ